MSNPAYHEWAPGVIYATGTSKTDGFTWDFQHLNVSSGWQPQVIKYNYSAGKPIKIEGTLLDGNPISEEFSWRDTWRGALREQVLYKALREMLEVQR